MIGSTTAGNVRRVSGAVVTSARRWACAGLAILSLDLVGGEASALT